MSHTSKVVKFNVGGRFFETSYDTVTRYSTMLKSLVEHEEIARCDEEGRIQIDRDGKFFRYVLNFMRDSKVFLPDSLAVLSEIINEAEFYAFQNSSFSGPKHLEFPIFAHGPMPHFRNATFSYY